MFRVDQGQPCFFSRPKRGDRDQVATYEQREISQEMPYESTGVKKSRRARRNTPVPDANRKPRVFRVVQDLMRLVHNMLPLQRIRKIEEQRTENKCWEHSTQGAFNFAAPDRVAQLLRHVDAQWFHPGEDGHHCKYSLKADKITDAIEALKIWLQPRAGKNETQDEKLEIRK